MSENFYSEIQLHIVWHTKENAPLLIPKIEVETHHYLAQRIRGLQDVYCHDIGGTETHVHMALTIKPTVLISELVGQLKGASSREINAKFQQKVLHWQSGYGVVSFGKKDLPWVVRYIQNQKEHHAKGTTTDRLEWTLPLTTGG